MAFFMDPGAMFLGCLGPSEQKFLVMETNLSKKNKLIKQISKASDMVPFSDFLLEFMDRYGLNNLRESTVEQLEEFISNRNIIPLLGEAPQRCLF